MHFQHYIIKKKDEAESIYNNFIDNNNNKSIEEY